MSDMRKILILPHVKAHNANALSSPFTIGFPAMTAWLGAVHALQRHLNDKGLKAVFSGVAVVCHDMDLQTYRGTNDYVSSIVGTANPLDKTGARSAFIEEPRCHLDVSLVIELSNINQEQHADLTAMVSFLLNAKMKLAGGDIQGFDTPEVMVVEENLDKDISKLTRKLMPGYVLIERRELMVQAMEGGQDGLDALIDYLAIHHRCEQDTEGVVSWHKRRKWVEGKPAGWIVPIATGFHGLSELGEAKNQRDSSAPHRFAESLVTLGEFKMPYHFKSLEAMLWRYHYDKEKNLYQCRQTAALGAIAKLAPAQHIHLETETLDEEFD